MTLSRKSLSTLYIAMGLLAWILTSLHLPAYLPAGFVDGTALFWHDALLASNSAGKFLTIDILFLALAIVSWMIFEARERRMKGLPFYILLGLFIGISLAVPLFLAARQRAIVKANPADATVTLSGGDIAWLLAIGVVTLAGAAATFIPMPG